MAWTVQANEFKSRCLRLLDEVAETGDTLTVTKNGRAVVEVRPAVGGPKSIHGALAGTIDIVGDIVSPVGEEWEAQPPMDRDPSTS